MIAPTRRRSSRAGRSAIVLALLPTAWRFGKGSRIRLAIGGADADHYGQVPHGRPPLFTVRRGESFLDLPLRHDQS